MVYEAPAGFTPHSDVEYEVGRKASIGMQSDLRHLADIPTQHAAVSEIAGWSYDFQDRHPDMELADFVMLIHNANWTLIEGFMGAPGFANDGERAAVLDMIHANFNARAELKFRELGR